MVPSFLVLLNLSDNMSSRNSSVSKFQNLIKIVLVNANIKILLSSTGSAFGHLVLKSMGKKIFKYKVNERLSPEYWIFFLMV